jgi:hypothetical protein
MFTYCNEYKKMILLACKYVRTILLRDKPYTVGRCGSIVTRSPYKKHGHLPCLSGRCIGRSKRPVNSGLNDLSSRSTPLRHHHQESRFSLLTVREKHCIHVSYHQKRIKNSDIKRLLHDACLEEKIF